MPSITLRNLSVGYQHPRRTPTTVLAELNATLYAGQLTCLVGANGIGKSTLLRTLAAFQPPISGQMCYYSDEQAAPINLATLSQARLARLVSVVLTAKPSRRTNSCPRSFALHQYMGHTSRRRPSHGGVGDGCCGHNWPAPPPSADT